jgi:acetyltransferase-like isoleucine patch superfamily enzyme
MVSNPHDNPQGLPESLGYFSKFLVIGKYCNSTHLRIDHPQTYHFENDKIVCTEDGKVYIGNFCSLSNVVIYVGGEHNYRWVTNLSPDLIYSDKRVDLKDPIYVEQPALSSRCYRDGKLNTDVHIGNDVWIGADSKVLCGVSIGDGAVIGANSVVSKDIPPYVIAVGNPIKIVGYRFTQDQIESLIKIQWWYWSIEKIMEFSPLLFSSNIDLFIKKALE